MPTPPPPLIARLAAEGCTGDPDSPLDGFRVDESIAMVRHFAALLGERSAAAGDALSLLIVAIGEASLERYKLPQPLACKKGCAHCCFQHVSVFAPEVFRVARLVRAADDAAAVTARLGARLAARTPDPHGTGKMSNPCGFLVKGACSIHVERPLICRIYGSFDAHACLVQLAQGVSQIPHPAFHGLFRTWIGMAVKTALAANGLPGRDYELTSAVAAVVADPGIEARWYAGDDALAGLSGPLDRPGGGVADGVPAWRAMAGV